MSPALPRPETSCVRISFVVAMSGPRSAAGAGVGEQGHLACVLDRTGDEALLLDGDTGDATGADLAALRDELAQGRDVLVVDQTDLDALRGSNGLAALGPRLAAVAARLARPFDF